MGQFSRRGRVCLQSGSTLTFTANTDSPQIHFYLEDPLPELDMEFRQHFVRELLALETKPTGFSPKSILRGD